MAAAAIAASTHNQQTPPSPVPNVILIDERGARTTLDSFRGRVVLISFFPSTDDPGGSCTAIAGKFLYLQRNLPASGYKLLEITRDPDRDSPQRLHSYARLFDAEPQVWSFLTGDRRQIEALARALGAPKRRRVAQDEPLFVLDAHGRLVGTLATSDWSPEDALALAAHASSIK